MSQDEYPGTFKEGTETLTALIRETFDHFQSAGSAWKWWEVHRSALLEAKCLLLEAKVALST